MNEFMGNTMGGQNPYAGQDTGFGDFLKPKPMPEGNYGSVDPAQFGNENIGMGYGGPGTGFGGGNPEQGMGGMGNGRMNPQTLSMMLRLLRGR